MKSTLLLTFVTIALACITLAAMTVATIALAAQAGTPKSDDDSLEQDYAAELPRIPPLQPPDALHAFHLPPGFRIEQVAAEPLVTDPVAIAFDEWERLFVVEMRGYSEDGAKNLGRVRLLEDSDRDGRFDKSTVYLDNLSWPTAITCYDGGVFIGAAPDLIYAKDTDSDGKADQSDVVWTGFGRDNVQGLLNTFLWGLDNRIHGSASRNGGTIRATAQPDEPHVALRGRDFSLDPTTRQLQPTSGGAQHGMSFDRWGNKFVCSNSDHVQLVMFDDRYIARNPYLAAPNPRLSIAADGPQADVFRRSPVEPWRIVRTRLRVKGIVKGPVEGGGRAAGYFTSATGITIYSGDAFPAEFSENVFVGDVGGNLVHRKVLSPDGLAMVARRADADREFITSEDIWFRPVQFANAPDGTLYVVDMYREVIEHPLSLPPLIKKHLDLTSGRDRGRIYRVVPADFRQPRRPLLAEATAAELVQALAHANGWHRRTAARLIFERQDPQSVPFLEELAAASQLPVARMEALWALNGLGALRPEVLLPRTADPHPRVREHAVRLSEPHVHGSPALQARLESMVADPDPHVRYQLAFTLGESRGARRPAALAQLARHDGGDRWMRLALLSSLFDGAGDVLTRLVHDTRFRRTADGQQMIEEVARQIGAQNRPAELAAFFQAVNQLGSGDKAAAESLVRGVMQGAGKNQAVRDQFAAASQGQAASLLDDLLAASKQIAVETTADEEDRLNAIGALGFGSFGDARNVLERLLDHKQPHRVQMAALATLGRFDDAGVPPMLIEAFQRLSPQLRREALEAIFSRRQWQLALLDAIDQGQFAATDLDPQRAALLLADEDESVRKRAQSVLAAGRPMRRDEVIAAYQGALQLEGNRDSGRAIFRKHCATCHQLEGHGHQIGPSLAAARNRGAEAVLVSVLDPSREVDPRYINYRVQTEQGRIASGMIDAETATSITLKRAENATETVLRRDIALLQSTGLSIMPEGMEKEIDPQGLADLIAYLLAIENQ